MKNVNLIINLLNSKTLDIYTDSTNGEELQRMLLTANQKPGILIMPGYVLNENVPRCKKILHKYNIFIEVSALTVWRLRIEDRVNERVVFKYDADSSNKKIEIYRNPSGALSIVTPAIDDHIVEDIQIEINHDGIDPHQSTDADHFTKVICKINDGYREIYINDTHLKELIERRLFNGEKSIEKFYIRGFDNIPPDILRGSSNGDWRVEVCLIIDRYSGLKITRFYATKLDIDEDAETPTDEENFTCIPVTYKYCNRVRKGYIEKEVFELYIEKCKREMCEPRDKYFNVYKTPLFPKCVRCHINEIDISDEYLYHELYKVLNYPRS